MDKHHTQFGKVKRMTPALLDEFVKRNVPVVFPANPIDRNAAFVDMCRRSSLLGKYGDHEVILSSSNAHSYVDLVSHANSQ